MTSESKVELRAARLRLTNLEATKIEAEIVSLNEATRKVIIEADASALHLLQVARNEKDRAADVELQREFHYFSGINSVSVNNCIETLGHWSLRDPGEPMTVIFNSPGGSVFDGFALFDYIQGLRRKGHHVTTKAIGTAASMGGILLQAGDTRVMDKRAYMLIHEISAGMSGKASEMEDFGKLIKRLETTALDILSERSTLTPTQIRTKWKKTDWWLTADEALEFGFVDEVA